jgi:hypothetical protein
MNYFQLEGDGFMPYPPKEIDEATGFIRESGYGFATPFGRGEQSLYNNRSCGNLAVTDFPGFLVVNLGALTDEYPHGNHRTLSDNHAFV